MVVKSGVLRRREQVQKTQLSIRGAEVSEERVGGWVRGVQDW